MENTNQPAWAERNKTTFRHAAAWIKTAVRALHMTPKWFAVKNNADGSMDVWVWNSRRAEQLDAGSTDDASHYLA